MNSIIQQQLPAIKKICQEEGISYLALFGSHVRGDEKPNSDIDMIVDFYKRVSLLDLSRIALRFEDHLGKKVDLLTKRSIKPMLRLYINQDRKVLFHDQSRPRLYQRYPASYHLN